MTPDERVVQRKEQRIPGRPLREARDVRPEEPVTNEFPAGGVVRDGVGAGEMVADARDVHEPADSCDAQCQEHGAIGVALGPAKRSPHHAAERTDRTLHTTLT